MISSIKPFVMTAGMLGLLVGLVLTNVPGGFDATLAIDAEPLLYGGLVMCGLSFILPD
ncbi:MAG: hypothetical protein AAFO79_09710 [Pseudomonadota bacterium]